MTHTEVLGLPDRGARFVFLNSLMPKSLDVQCFFLGGVALKASEVECSVASRLFRAEENEDLGLVATLPESFDDVEPWVVRESVTPTEEDRLWMNASTRSVDSVLRVQGA
jgi:hypothetical protein